MAKKQKEENIKMVLNEKEYEFLYSELSTEARAQYDRANELAAQIMHLERQAAEVRFLANNYIRFVAEELDNKNVDKKEEK